ncbi:HAD family hydrolase [Paenibacillus sp. J5C_2022]|uniref:HAD family hydrolase n=1 Tax=Paenibacillus sp. J5C2022 TaxID=2977129 RepID=UPI0021D28D21|nr:HAD family hydrolase [Paenibacillus sp. J5C2022]MCU6708656.1 HAD family hydrolase [Paenibacillus sp. J5C2022]
MTTGMMISGHRTAIKGILFDKDGTLLDFISLWGSWTELLMNGVYARLRQEVPAHRLPESLAALFGVECDIDGKVVSYNTEGLLSTGSSGAIRQAIIRYAQQAGMDSSTAVAIADESLEEAYIWMEQLRPVRIKPHLIHVLKHFSSRGLKLAVVTADETADAVKHLEWLGIGEYFETIIGNDSVPNGKPNPDMIHLACRRIGVSPSEVVMIGDTDSDMRMGKAAGVAWTVAIVPEELPENQGTESRPFGSADAIISSYDQLLASLTHINHEGEEMLT